jgi:hypothetical protein
MLITNAWEFDACLRNECTFIEQASGDSLIWHASEVFVTRRAWDGWMHEAALGACSLDSRAPSNRRQLFRVGQEFRKNRQLSGDL